MIVKNVESLEARRGESLRRWADRRGAFWFAGTYLPFEAAATHLLYCGATGSGKTVSQRMLYQTTLAPTIGQGLSHRCLAYDPKGDLHRILFGMGIPRDCVRTLCPFDQRSCAWDMASDVADEATAYEIACILIPDAQESQPFFRNAARDIVTGVIYSLVRSREERGVRWTFGDVLQPLFKRDTALLKATLARWPETEDRLQYFNNKETSDNVISTVRALMRPFQTIAALWDEAEREGEDEMAARGLGQNPRLVSLEAWARDRRGEVLILGNSQKLQKTLWLVNQAIFKRASQILLSLPELQPGKSRRTWICIDEARDLKLDGLQGLLTQGRSKGICCVLGFQSIEGLRDSTMWGEHVAHELTGQCRSKAFFGVGDAATAKWVAQSFGELERVETSWTKSVSKSSRNLDLIEATGTKTESESRQRVKRDAVLDNELLGMPPTDATNGLHGFYISPHFLNAGFDSSFQKIHIPAKDIFGGQLQELSPPEDDLDSNMRPPAHQRQQGRTDESFCARFGIVLEEGAASAPPAAEAGRPGRPPRRFMTEED